MKKQISLFLVLLMAVGGLSACAGDAQTDPALTTAAPAAANTTAPAQTGDPTRDENGFLLDELPADLRFDGERLGILTWTEVEMPEFDVKEITGEIVNDAIYQRNEIVKERLGLDIEWYDTKGNAQNTANYLKVAQNSFNSGDGAYDIYAAYSRSTGLVAANGLCYNLNHVDYLDLEKPWWPERLTETCTINGKLFFISGDISTNLLHFMYGVYYNRDMIADYQLTDPTEYVQNGTWTQDKMIEMTQGLYADLNNDGKADPDDRYGMTSVYWHLDALYTGAGMRLVEPNDDKTLIVSRDFVGEKAIDYVDKLKAWVASDDFQAGENGSYEDTFVNGNCLFSLNRMYLADRKLRDVSFTYGIVPAPKYDEQQQDYITVMGHPFTLYAITRDCKDPDRAAAFLEAMSSAGYRLTTPAIFETNMKVKYSENSTMAAMFDTIRAGVDFDLGRIFSDNLNYMPELIAKAIWGNQNWASMAKINDKLLTTQLARIVEQINAYE